MSFFLISSLGVLLLGAVVAAGLAWRRPRYAPASAAIALTLALIIWLLAGLNLPLGSDPVTDSGAGGMWSVRWWVDTAGWQLSLFLLLMVEAVVVTSLSHFDQPGWNGQRALRVKVLFPAILVASAAALLTIWIATLNGLLISWVVLSFAWLLLLWSVSAEGSKAGTLVYRGGALLLGALFLWLTVAFFGGEVTGQELKGPWPENADIVLLLAAMSPLGALPLHWWRPLAWSLPAETAALIHLLPVVAGGSLLSHIGGLDTGQGTTFTLMATSLGLIGMLAGISIAWMYVASPSRSLSGLALAQAGVVVLTAAWAGTDGVLAATRVFVLAISGLFLAARWSPRRLPWPAIIPLLALAGAPLTAGFSGLTVDYDAWLDGQRVVLLIVGTLLSMFLLAAGILAVRREMPADELAARRPIIRARHYLALALPSLGLLAPPGGMLGDISLWAWLAVGVAAGGSLVLSRYEAKLQDAQLALRRALHLGYIGRRLVRFFADAGAALDGLVREVAAILEGEGGMLWLLVFAVVIWLARR